MQLLFLWSIHFKTWDILFFIFLPSGQHLNSHRNHLLSFSPLKKTTNTSQQIILFRSYYNTILVTGCWSICNSTQLRINFLNSFVSSFSHPFPRSKTRLEQTPDNAPSMLNRCDDQEHSKHCHGINCASIVYGQIISQIKMCIVRDMPFYH